VSDYTKRKFGSEAVEFRELGKGFHGTGYLVVLKDGRRMVLKTLRPEAELGHEYAADRAQVLFLANEIYDLPNHIKAYDAGAVTKEGLVSAGNASDFFLMMEELPAGAKDYKQDLERIMKEDKLTERDRKRAKILAEYLAKIHSMKKDAPSLYKRKIREAVCHNELMTGVIDLYPEKLTWTTDKELTDLSKTGLEWWGRLKKKTKRLSAIHGDFYFNNIFFDDSDKLTVTDRSRGAWGEPAEDVVTVVINWMMWAFLKHGEFRGPFRELTDMFIKTYIDKTKDKEILEMMPLFFISRAPIVCCPVFYPDSSYDKARRKLFDFVWDMHKKGRFEP
jgi:aminoglycoside phosphotransferase family enzyme